MQFRYLSKIWTSSRDKRDYECLCQTGESQLTVQAAKIYAPGESSVGETGCRIQEEFKGAFGDWRR